MPCENPENVLSAQNRTARARGILGHIQGVNAYPDKGFYSNQRYYNKHRYYQLFHRHLYH
jgi:hypothetical protein